MQNQPHTLHQFFVLPLSALRDSFTLYRTLADVTGYGLVQAFYLEANETKNIEVPQCCIIYVNVGGGGDIVIGYKRYHTVSSNPIFGLQEYSVTITQTGVTQLSIRNNTDVKHLIRYRIICLL